jgi:plasmid stabilization system protein ParE
MPQALRTFAAEHDLEEIGYQIAVNDGRPETARRILKELVAQCDRLAELAAVSELGTAAPEIGEGVRLFTFK